MTSRVLVFGCDSGDTTTARELVAAGRMPALARLLAEGTQHPLTEYRGGTYVAERWTSMVTGVDPEVHGFWRFADSDPDRFIDRQAPLDPNGTPRIWDVASEAGQRVAVFDVPRQPLAEVNGIHVDGWGTHDQLYPRTSPPDLLARLDARFGSNPFTEELGPDRLGSTPCDFLHRSAPGTRTNDELTNVVALIHDSVDRRAHVSEHLLHSEPWDLYFTVFAETHCAGHQCWHLRHPDTVREHEQATLLGDVVAETYERVDASLARHVELAGPDAVVAVVLHAGMRRVTGANDLLWAIVAELGGPYRACEYSGGIGAIRLHLRGRDPGGVVVGADEADAVSAVLEAQLLRLVDERTQEPAVRAMRTRAEMFPEVDDAALPDFFVEWSGDRRIETVSSPDTGTVHRPSRTARTGDHSPDGLVVVRGPSGLQPGEVMPPAAFAPMLARMLGVDQPDGAAATAAASSA